MSGLKIALAFVLSDGQQVYQEFEVAKGSTIFEILMGLDQLDNQMPGFRQWCITNQDAKPNHKAWYVGIYSQKKPLKTQLSDGDRIEIYRPLSLDPMAKRKIKSKKNST